MPHAAVLAAGITVGAAMLVGSAVAYEMWRENQGEEPLMEGVKAGWLEFKNDVRRGLWDFRERMDGRDPSERRPIVPDEGTIGTDAEMDEVQGELDDIEMHERQMSTARQLWKEQSGETFPSVRRRRLNGSYLQEDEGVDAIGGMQGRLINASDMRHVPNEVAPSVTLFEGFRTPQTTAGRAGSNSSTIVSDEEWYSRANSPLRSINGRSEEEDGNISDSWTQLETESIGSHSTHSGR